MNAIVQSANERKLALQAELRRRYPRLLSAARPHARIDRSAIVLGRDEHSVPFFLPLRARLEHMHAIGTTGGGKSSLLAHCIRQDIINGSGVVLVDPHGDHPGSTYRSLLSWLDERRLLGSRTVHLIDPNAPSHIVGFNPLQRPDAETDLSVIAGVALEAFERVWGGEDTQTKPTIRRVLKATFVALAELGLTLVEAGLLYDPDDPAGIRAWAIENVKDSFARDVLKRLDQLAQDPRTRRDFATEVVGPINRLAEFVSSAAIRSIVGQTQNTIDLRAAMDEGHVILVNLSGGQRVYERDADLLGRLLTRFVCFHAKRRRHPERPFFVYLDECHRYVSGDLENILAELRKFGVGTVLSHQWQAQLAKDDESMLAAVRNATNVKVVFRIKDPVEAAELADMVFNYNLEMPVRALTKPVVVGHRLVRLKSESESEQVASTDTESRTEGWSVSESEGWAESTADTVGEARMSAEGEAAMSADVVSSGNAAASGTSSGLSKTFGIGLQTSPLGNPAIQADVFGNPIITGVAESEGAQSSHATMNGFATSQGRSASASRGRSSSTATTVGQSVSGATAYTESVSRSVGTAKTRGQGRAQGVQEAFEPLLEDRPVAVHGLDNVRFMAAQVLCNLTTGRAAISFVDTGGMKRAALTVAHVETPSLPEVEFNALRERVLAASPSATPVAEALQSINVRSAALIEAAVQTHVSKEPATASAYRVKKRRPQLAKRERPLTSQPSGAAVHTASPKVPVLRRRKIEG